VMIKEDSKGAIGETPESYSYRLTTLHDQPQMRVSGYGQLIHWDTLQDDWLESWGEPVWHLVCMVDDCTRWTWGRFVYRDSTEENMRVLWRYLERCGRMVEVCTDRNSKFFSAGRRGRSGFEKGKDARVTQIRRALRELDIGWLPTDSPLSSARPKHTLDTNWRHIVTSLRLADIKTLQAANSFLEEEYWPGWNERFARPLTSCADLHRPLTGELDLASSLSHVERRVIADDYTFSFERHRYQIASEESLTPMRGRPLRVERGLGGGLRARYEGRLLTISECSPLPRAAVSVRAAPKRAKMGSNAARNSGWMDGFFERPAAPSWQAIHKNFRYRPT
jgi:hypothetical protein